MQLIVYNCTFIHERAVQCLTISDEVVYKVERRCVEDYSPQHIGLKYNIVLYGNVI